MKEPNRERKNEIKALTNLSQDQKDGKATILEKTIAIALQKGLEKGSLYSIETLLTRAFGKPKELVHQEHDGKIEVVFVDNKTIL